MKYLITLFVLASTILNSIAQPGSNDGSFNPSDLGNGVGGGANNIIQTVSLQNDGSVFIGGNFTAYNGVTMNRLSHLNSNGTIDFNFTIGTGPNNIVYKIALQDDGKILIGGNFTSYDGTAINRIARLNADGSLDPSFNVGTGFNASVRSISIQNDGKIVVGGNFTSVNGVLTTRIVRLNSDGSIDATFNCGSGLNALVYTSEIQNDGKIIVGGNFTSYNGITKNRIVRLNSDGSLDSNFLIGNAANNVISVIKIQDDGKILIGGNFTSYNGTGRNRIARLNATGNLDVTFAPGTGLNNSLGTIALQSDGKIIVGGNFTTMNGLARNRIIRLNTNGTNDASFLNFGGASGNVLASFIQPDGKILIGGACVIINGTVKSRLARLNSDGVLDQTFNTVSSFNGTVQTLSIQADGKIIVGGNFSSYFGVSKNRIVRINSDATLDASFLTGTGVNNWVYASEIQSDGKILIGGTFTMYNGTTKNRIVRLNQDGTIDMSFVIGSGFNGIVRSISIQSDGKIIVGGGFTSFNGTSIKRIVRLNSDGSLDPSFVVGLGANNLVLSSAIQSDGKIVICGSFTSYNGVIMNRLARLNSDGSLDPTLTIGTGFNNGVNCVAIQNDGKICAVGSFTTYNGASKNRLVRILSNGGIDPSFSIGSGSNGVLQKVLISSDDKIICVGGFTYFNGISRNRIVRLNSNGDVDLTFDSSLGANGVIQTGRIQSNGKIVIGGSFTSYENIGRNRIARVESCTSISNQVTSSCNSYTWNGNTYTSSGTYSYITNNSMGCDSTVILNLTINNSNSGTDIINYCNNYTWIDGITYSSSNNTATYVLPNQYGCDSVVTLNFTLLVDTLNVVGTHVVSTCSANYTWIDGITYTSNNNTATFVLPNQNGCDSTVTLNLTLNGSTAEDNITACNQYTWIDGITYTASNNSATYILNNQLGCDSLVTLNLTLNNVVVSVTNSPPNLTANLPGASYQWLNCENNYAEILGQTGQTFVTPGFGSYAVMIDNGICIDTSECMTALLSVSESIIKPQFIIFPNPSTGKFYFQSVEPISFEIVNIHGKLIFEAHEESSLFEVNLEKETSGIYFVNMTTSKGIVQHKIVVQ